MDDTATTLRDLLLKSRPRTASLGWPIELRHRVLRRTPNTVAAVTSAAARERH